MFCERPRVGEKNQRSRPVDRPVGLVAQKSPSHFTLSVGPEFKSC